MLNVRNSLHSWVKRLQKDVCFVVLYIRYIAFLLQEPCYYINCTHFIPHSGKSDAFISFVSIPAIIWRLLSSIPSSNFIPSYQLQCLTSGSSPQDEERTIRKGCPLSKILHILRPREKYWKDRLPTGLIRRISKGKQNTGNRKPRRNEADIITAELHKSHRGPNGTNPLILFCRTKTWRLVRQKTMGVTHKGAGGISASCPKRMLPNFQAPTGGHIRQIYREWRQLGQRFCRKCTLAISTIGVKASTFKLPSMGIRQSTYGTAAKKGHVG